MAIILNHIVNQEKVIVEKLLPHAFNHFLGHKVRQLVMFFDVISLSESQEFLAF